MFASCVKSFLRNDVRGGDPRGGERAAEGRRGASDAVGPFANARMHVPSETLEEASRAARDLKRNARSQSEGSATGPGKGLAARDGIENIASPTTSRARRTDAMSPPGSLALTSCCEGEPSTPAPAKRFPESGPKSGPATLRATTAVIPMSTQMFYPALAEDAVAV